MLHALYSFLFNHLLVLLHGVLLLMYSPTTTNFNPGAGVAQLVSARPSELEVPGSILGDSNVCLDFILICVA